MKPCYEFILFHTYNQGISITFLLKPLYSIIQHSIQCLENSHAPKKLWLKNFVLCSFCMSRPCIFMGYIAIWALTPKYLYALKPHCDRTRAILGRSRILVVLEFKSHLRDLSLGILLHKNHSNCGR